MIKKTIYQCEHCTEYTGRPRKLMNKTEMKKHEEECLYNKKNKTCFSCFHNSRLSHKVHACPIHTDLGDITSKNLKRNCKDYENKKDVMQIIKKENTERIKEEIARVRKLETEERSSIEGKLKIIH